MMDIAYYPGCSLKSSSAIYDVQNQRVFEALGIHLKEIPDWNCCGATSAGKVDDFLAIAMPARNLGIAEATGLGEMIIPCSACYSRTLVAQCQLEKNPELKETINAELSKKISGKIKISSILEVLLSAVESGMVAQQAQKKLKGLKPACYYGCMQTRFPFKVPVPDNVENPQGMEKVLKAIGIQSLDWSYKTDCCGASSAVNDEDAADALMARIMKDAVARGANCFVVTCPMCQFNLDSQQNRFGPKHGIRERLPVFFITEILGLAMGMGVEELQIDRHLTDSTKLLKELKLI